ncbi:hypothetical protein JNK13_03545 [bacterium]|nr:hypothetical protein [bacterium]
MFYRHLSWKSIPTPEHELEIRSILSQVNNLADFVLLFSKPGRSLFFYGREACIQKNICCEIVDNDQVILTIELSDRGQEVIFSSNNERLPDSVRGYFKENYSSARAALVEEWFRKRDERLGLYWSEAYGGMTLRLEGLEILMAQYLELQGSVLTISYLQVRDLFVQAISIYFQDRASRRGLIERLYIELSTFTKKRWDNLS